MRLTKLTVALLMACLTKANIDFSIDADSLIDELKANNNNERNS